jgi:outer membrane receptor protein involved in Fe transport
MHTEIRGLATKLGAAAVITSLGASSLTAQSTGSIRGAATRRDDGAALTGVTVTVPSVGLAASTGSDGRYVLTRVPAGPQTIEFRFMGFAPYRTTVDVVPGQTTVVNASLEARPVRLADVIVSTPSRAPERIVEAPAAVAVVPPPLITAVAPTGQAPLVLAGVPGVDVVQSGVTDFNVNARGFNSSLTRRVLVVVDGRDPAIAFLGAQEWGTLGASLDDFARIEMVRGPGSAMYGANAFSGVLNLTSATAREAIGSRITVVGGELSTRRIDARRGGLFDGERFGYKVAAGYSTSDTWTRSRTRRDSTDIVREYAEATDASIAKARESRPLNGQETDSLTLAAIGDRDPIRSGYASARFDYYAPAGALGTIEGGLSESQNETLVTGIGRVQVSRVQRPWARAAWGSERLNLLAWYTGRQTPDPEWSLGSGLALREHSSVFHGEAQYNDDLANDRGRWVIGASARSTQMSTSNTLVAPANDGRTDHLYSAYGQLELRLAAKLKFVTATRWDEGTLFAAQFSPKAALFYAPDDNSSLRVSVNRAFQLPNYAEFFLYTNAGAPTASPRALENALEGFLATGQSIGTPGLPNSLPWNFDAQTRVLAIGNRSLSAEKITGYEVGYKTATLRRGYLTLDLFWNDTRDFVTDLLPNVNPNYPQYRYDAGGTNVPGYLDAIVARANSLPAGSISDAQRQQIIAGAQALRRNYDALVAATQPLLTVVDGHPALVVSYANAGRVVERGGELGLSTQVTDALRADATYSYFDFVVRRASIGTDALLPNTPKHKGSAGVMYASKRGIELGGSLRFASGYPWAAGVYSGFVPASQTLNMNAAYQATQQLKVFALATNALDQKRFQIYGGSIVARRVLAGATATF